MLCHLLFDTDKAAQAGVQGSGMGSANSSIPGLTSAQIGQLALALQGLAGLGDAQSNILRQLTAAAGLAGPVLGGSDFGLGANANQTSGVNAQNLQNLLGLGGGGVAGGGASKSSPRRVQRLSF